MRKVQTFLEETPDPREHTATARPWGVEKAAPENKDSSGEALRFVPTLSFAPWEVTHQGSRGYQSYHHRDLNARNQRKPLLALPSTWWNTFNFSTSTSLLLWLPRISELSMKFPILTGKYSQQLTRTSHIPETWDICVFSKERFFPLPSCLNLPLPHLHWYSSSNS